MVRAPKAGYDFPAKSEYREQIWQTFVEHIPDPTQAQVAFFPGPEGLEIPVALKYGFKLENLHAIEAEKIEMPWRNTLPPKPYVLDHLGHAHKIEAPNKHLIDGWDSL
jgi:hypothetical protein